MEAAIKLMKMSESEWGSVVGGGEGRRPTQAPLGALQTSKYVKTGRRIVRVLTSLSIAFSFRSRCPGPSPAGVIFPWCSAATSCSCSLCLLLLFSPPSCFLFVFVFFLLSLCVFAYFAFELHYLQFSFRFIIHLNGKDWYNVIQDNLFISYRFFCVLLVLEIFGIPDPSRPLRRISRPEMGIFGSV